MDRKGVQELDEDILFPVETEITQSGTEELVIVPSVASNNRFEVVHNGPHCTSAVPGSIVERRGRLLEGYGRHCH